MSPAESPRQQRFMGAELGRARAGMKTKTGMGQNRLRDFAGKPAGGFRNSPRAMALKKRMGMQRPPQMSAET